MREGEHSAAWIDLGTGLDRRPQPGPPRPHKLAITSLPYRQAAGLVKYRRMRINSDIQTPCRRVADEEYWHGNFSRPEDTVEDM